MEKQHSGVRPSEKDVRRVAELLKELRALEAKYPSHDPPTVGTLGRTRNRGYKGGIGSAHVFWRRRDRNRPKGHKRMHPLHKEFLQLQFKLEGKGQTLSRWWRDLEEQAERERAEREVWMAEARAEARAEIEAAIASGQYDTSDFFSFMNIYARYGRAAREEKQVH